MAEVKKYPKNMHAPLPLSVAQWHALCQQGACLSVKTLLNGESMRPLIRRNRDRVTVIPLQRPLKKGDVVLFQSPDGRYVVHRVWKLEETRLQTLGDNCRFPDPWIPPEQVLGLVTCMERGGKTYTLDSSLARMWGRCWMGIYPLRKSYLLLRGIAAGLWRRIKRWKNET